MIGKLSGIVDYIGLDYIIIDVHGVGYIVYTLQSIILNLSIKDEVSFFIKMQVKQDDIALFGFPDRKALDWFNILNEIQGIGAKAACGILNVLNPEEITEAIIKQDQDIFKRVSGVGPKLASRIINELKNKKTIFKENITVIGQSGYVSNITIEESVAALTNLGFNKLEATKLAADIQKSQPDINTEELIKVCLISLGSKY